MPSAEDNLNNLYKVIEIEHRRVKSDYDNHLACANRLAPKVLTLSDVLGMLREPETAEARLKELKGSDS